MNDALDRFFISLISLLDLITRRLDDLEKRLQYLEQDSQEQEAEYEAITQAEIDARIDFAIGYGFPRDERLEPFEEFMKGLLRRGHGKN